VLNKKGVAIGRIVIILVTLFSFLVIMPILGVFTSSADAKSEEQVCHASVVLRTATTIDAGLVDIKAAPLLCETLDRKIGGDREEIKDQVAQMMTRCWWMFNQGKQDDTFKNALVTELLGFDDEGNGCFLCYAATIDQDGIRRGNLDQPRDVISSSEMFDYLLEEEHPKIAGTTYNEYIQSSGGPGIAVVGRDIFPRQSYGVAYLSKSSNNAQFGVGDVLAIVTTAAAAAGVLLCFTGAGCAIGAPLIAASSVGAGTVGTYTAIRVYTSLVYTEERDVSMVVFDSIDNIQHNGGCQEFFGG
jgi:hypothetical protein